jgi:hypothetical protein
MVMGNVIALVMNARVLKGRRLPLKIVEKHCRENGHVEGGNEYRPMVSN